MNGFAAATYPETTVFALERQIMANTATGSLTDVFARCERHTAATFEPGPKRISVSFQIGGHDIALTYLDFGGGLPPWARPVLGSLSERWGVGLGWDSYDAKPTELQYAVKLLNHLSNLMKASTAPPVVTPLADGGVQAEWHTGDKDFEIVVPAEKPSRFYFYNAVTRQEEEGFLDSNYSQVRRILESI